MLPRGAVIRHTAGMRRVAITGLGIVSGFGDEVDAFWDAILAGRSAVREVQLPGLPVIPAVTVLDFDADAAVGRREAKRMDRVGQLAAAAAGAGARGLQGQRDAFEHQHRHGGLLKQGRHLAGEAGEGQGRHGVLPCQHLERGCQLGQQTGHDRITMQQALQAMAPDGGQQCFFWHGIQLLP